MTSIHNNIEDSFHQVNLTAYKMSISNFFEIQYLPMYFVCVIGILSNAMLLVALVKDPLKCFRNSATYLIGNLALSDLMYNFALIPTVNPSSTIEACLVFQFLLLYTSTGTIFSIALDRYFIVCHPFKHRFFMSGNRMVVWIGMVWVLSSIHSLKRIFAPNDNDLLAKPGVALSLIILTALLYGKTYYLLRKQAKSMLEKRSALPSQQRNLTSNQSCISTDTLKVITIADSRRTLSSYSENEHIANKTLVRDAICGPFQSQNYRAVNDSYRARDSLERFRSATDRACSLDVFVEEKKERSELELNKRAGTHTERAPNRDERAEGHYERAGNVQRAESLSERIQVYDERVQCFRERVQNHDERAESPDKRSQTQDERVRNQITRARSRNDEPGASTSSTQNPSPQNLSVEKRKRFQTINNGNEQKFLNTIIIIAFVAVITVAPGTLFLQIWHEAARDSNNGNGFLSVVIGFIYCLNFAVNPFIYCWRLGRYRKTFKILLGCKS
ncbi:uncharacterized protein LOC114535136 [Dendronephthya gigantea]|uniref:uncharacterized protein LOC114535136 n=1 Tax=Dendronephthya gigantea TaxID=151771 RepID=UPI00106B2B73|nr:uncharacterized protein LOC114535136 [Dendronephthya gigantea]